MSFQVGKPYIYICIERERDETGESPSKTKYIYTSSNSLCLAWLFESKYKLAKLGKRGVEQRRGDQVLRLKIFYRLWD